MNTYSKILFVCLGNTCRSPMAATIMQHCMQGTDMLVESRGLVVLFPEPYNPKAVALASGYGMIMPNNNARQIEDKDFGNDVLVLVMDMAMKEKIYDTFENAINVYTLGEFIREPEREIEDPYGRGMEEYNKCFVELKDMIEKAAQIILDNIKAGSGEE